MTETEGMIERVLHDPAASYWLKDALGSALSRDPVDAANDSVILAHLLKRRFWEILREFGKDGGH